MPKYAVHKKINAEMEVTRIADIVEADSDSKAIAETIGDHLIGVAGALRYNGGFFPCLCPHRT